MAFKKISCIKTTRQSEKFRLIEREFSYNEQLSKQRPATCQSQQTAPTKLFKSVYELLSSFLSVVNMNAEDWWNNYPINHTLINKKQKKESYVS
jgi:hypothetical protein